MGYFASLMRQTGLRAPARPARSYAMERDVEVVAPPPAAAETPRAETPAPRQANLAAKSAEAAPASPFANVLPAPVPSIRPAPLRDAAPALARTLPEEPASALQEQRGTPIGEPRPGEVPAIEQNRMEVAHRESPAAAQVPVPARLPALKDRPAEQKPVTFQDVRAWVAQDPVPVSEQNVTHANPPAQTSKPAVRDAVQEASNYTLEIGNIQIVLDPPAPQPIPAAQAKTAAQPNTKERSAADSWTLASRYYLP